MAIHGFLTSTHTSRGVWTSGHPKSQAGFTILRIARTVCLDGWSKMALSDISAGNVSEYPPLLGYPVMLPRVDQGSSASLWLGSLLITASMLSGTTTNA